MGKTYKRGERRHRDNMKQKGRVTEVIRTWGGLDSWNSDDCEYLPRLRQRIVKSAKTRHPYSGDTRKVNEEYRPDYRGGWERRTFGMEE